MEELIVRKYKNEYGLYNTWTYRGSRLIKTEMSYPKTKINKKTKPMSKKQELFEQIEGLFTDFQEQHNGTTKKSQANARKAIGELKKLVTDYRKESVAESK
tara:strand:- start:480 stop:782 length:303 start_codon:yes stop_codon:yes gene_type:complete